MICDILLFGVVDTSNILYIKVVDFFYMVSIISHRHSINSLSH